MVLKRNICKEHKRLGVIVRKLNMHENGLSWRKRNTFFSLILDRGRRERGREGERERERERHLCEKEKLIGCLPHVLWTQNLLVQATVLQPMSKMEETIFEKVMVKDFPKLIKNINSESIRPMSLKQYKYK